jgi:hypothetical protein
MSLRLYYNEKMALHTHEWPHVEVRRPPHSLRSRCTFTLKTNLIFAAHPSVAEMPPGEACL